MESGKGNPPGRARVELHAVPADRGRPDAAATGAVAPTDHHPRIPHWRRPVRRTAGEVQFGVSPGGSIVTGVSEVETDLLSRLDGTLSLHASYRLAAEAGVPASRWRALLELVDRLDVLAPHSAAGTQDGPPAACPPTVVLEGHGSLVEDVCLLLRRGRLDAVVVSTRALAASAGRGGDPGTRPGLAVVAGPLALDPRSGDPWLRQGVPHLPVVAEDTRATVGPLVEPTLTGPCLWCLDLHRADRDAAWPTVLAQVCGAPGDLVPPDSGAETDPALAHLVAGCIALFARRLLGGAAVPPGISVEVSLPWPRMDHRRWAIHPRCRRRHRDGAGAGAG
ncbi:hypothetical protein [Intrasporangium sp. DVR]|uniref:hypothetical protein n=1 Tax=Intrasporangium sp. DVR TaxID=3127867 RepID=UPI00313A6300